MRKRQRREMKLAGSSCGSLRQQLHYAPTALPVSVLSSSWGDAPGFTFRALGAWKQSFADRAPP